MSRNQFETCGAPIYRANSKSVVISGSTPVMIPR